MTRKTFPRPTPIVYARGDGIGPEIMDATLKILEAAEAELDLHEIEIGQKVYERGVTAGIEPESWDVLRRTGVFLKAPITTPQGKGFKSLNVTTRKSLGLFANVRPCRSYHPFTRSLHPGMNIVVIRENEEDTYAGIEHRQTQEVTQCLKLISRPGCEKVVRYAFDYAERSGRRKVTCMSKDNIMKITDGLFHRVFDEIAADYPDIENEHMIVDIGSALVADSPEQFDVIVTPNLYGDIISDIAAQVAGSVGLAGSANIGESAAMFEAIHGSAPAIAGKNIANPSGLLHGAVMMLMHIDQTEVAERVRNAWLRTIEDGVHTADIRLADNLNPVVGTDAFAQAVIERLGDAPRRIRSASFGHGHEHAAPPVRPKQEKAIVGVDVFLDWDEPGRSPDALGESLSRVDGDGLKLKMITNRGVKVYPGGLPETFCTDHWRCRFVADADGATVSHAQVISLLGRVAEAGFDFIKTEHLCTFDGEIGYSLGQGE
ncbi:MAG: NADP-dependent isocitrate dehydrogenase [Planctomycetota bacterium]|nr:NADP-dependent isocitrate dehydrogenase [Planctomycetota bacterium]